MEQQDEWSFDLPDDELDSYIESGSVVPELPAAPAEPRRHRRHLQEQQALLQDSARRMTVTVSPPTTTTTPTRPSGAKRSIRTRPGSQTQPRAGSSNMYFQHRRTRRTESWAVLRQRQIQRENRNRPSFDPGVTLSDWSCTGRHIISTPPSRWAFESRQSRPLTCSVCRATSLDLVNESYWTGCTVDPHDFIVVDDTRLQCTSCGTIIDTVGMNWDKDPRPGEAVPI